MGGSVHGSLPCHLPATQHLPPLWSLLLYHTYASLTAEGFEISNKNDYKQLAALGGRDFGLQPLRGCRLQFHAGKRLLTPGLKNTSSKFSKICIFTWIALKIGVRCGQSVSVIQTWNKQYLKQPASLPIPPQYFLVVIFYCFFAPI